jgi:hypothetical protein
MAIEKLPEHLKSGRTAEAIMAPSAIVAAGVGAAGAILVGAPLLVTALVGGVAYGALVALRLPRRPKGPLDGIDPMSLSMPWRDYVHEALDAKRRFANVVQNAKTGPIRDRLAEIGGRVDAAVAECWRVARHGDALDEGIASLDLADVSRRLDSMQHQRPASPGAAESFDRTVDALKAQVASGQRITQVATDARARLEVLDARLDETVARAVELSLSAGDVSELSGLGDDVESLVGDMEALRQGLEEVRSTSGGSAS